MFHLARNFTSGSNLNQISFSNSRADLALSMPGATVLNELRPIRIKPALRWLGGVNTATCFHEEMALFARRLPQPADADGTERCTWPQTLQRACSRIERRARYPVR